jgi:hypothetical protein
MRKEDPSWRFALAANPVCDGHLLRLAAVNRHSWMAARHGAVYGTTRHLGAISIAQRAWARLDPEAKMHGRP